MTARTDDAVPVPAVDDLVTTSIDPNGVVTLTLDAPNRNALSPELVDRLHSAVDAVVTERPPALVIRARGTTFCGGFDLSQLDDEDDDHLRDRFRAIQRLLDRVRRAPVVSLAVVAGPAVGAGADLALACDVRVTTPQARFRFPGARFGVLLGTERLLEVAGASRLIEALTGRWIEADEAQRWGIVTHACPDQDGADATVCELVDGFAAIEPSALGQALAIVRSSAGEATALEPSLAAPGLHQRMLAYVQRAPTKR